MPQPTPHPDVNALLDALQSRLQAALRDKLVGLYLFGSLVIDAYTPGISDVDLLAVIERNLTPTEFDTLDAMHLDLMRAMPEWNDRIEIAYATRHALRTFKTEVNPIGIISPGEPFHIIEMDSHWLLNWYLVRERGVTLFGPPPVDLIAPITNAEFLAEVKASTLSWRDWVPHTRDSYPYQSYSTLTMCRAWYTLTTGEYPSKQVAAQWAREQFPDWAWLIDRAWMWRNRPSGLPIDPYETYPDAERFVLHVCAQIDAFS